MKTNLYIPTDTYRKLFLYAELCDAEISGLGLIRKEEERFFCDEVILVDQEVGSAHTDISPEGLSETLTRIGQERPDTWGHWKLWWHSHDKISASFSSTDDDTLEELARISGDWFFGLVINRRGDSQFYVATREPIPLFGKLEAAKDWRGETEDSMIGEVMADIEKHVTKTPVTPSQNPPLPTTANSTVKVGNKPLMKIGSKPSGQEPTLEAGEPIAPDIPVGAKGVTVFEGVRSDSATLGMCLMCGGPTEWRQASKNRLFLACSACVRGITNCVCPIPKEQGDPRFTILRMYWEEQDGIEKVAAEAKRLFAEPVIQDNGRKRRRPRNTRKLDGTGSS